MIIDALIRGIEAKSSRVCVGLDPQPEFVPETIKERCFKAHGKTSAGMAEAFLTYNKRIIDAVQDIVPCVKPQIAMYERFGPAGVSAYAETARYAKSKGFIVIGDVKRNDIASTAAAYAEGHLGGASVEGVPAEGFDTDFVTISPYLGRDSIEPFLACCKARNGGLFILVKTSNPGSGDIQDLECGGGKLYEHVGGLVAGWGKGFIGAYGYSSIGAVVGATWPEQAAALRKRMPETFFLIPGYGAQGGTAQDLAVCFDKNGRGGIVNSSRGIIAAWKKPEYMSKHAEGDAESWFADCAREETLKMRDDLNKHIG